MPPFLTRFTAILIRNGQDLMVHKRKLIGEFIMTALVCVFYGIIKSSEADVARDPANSQAILITAIMTLLVKIYLGFLGSGSSKELLTLFLTEKQSGQIQYQSVMGLNSKIHLAGNLFYIQLYMSLTILPFFLVVMFFNFNLLLIPVFGAYVISFSTFSLMMSAFFTDSKMANQVVGILLSLFALLPLSYDGSFSPKSITDYICVMMPNSAFSVSIIGKSMTGSFYSLVMAKFYISIYLLLTYCKPRQIIAFFKRRTVSTSALEQNLPRQIQLESDISQNSQPNSTNIFRLSKVTKLYSVGGKNVAALQDMSFSAKKGQIIGLLGRNGAGKTTIVDILTGTAEQTSGLVEMGPNTKIGICYQHEVLYEDLTLQQNIDFYCRLKCLPLQDANSAIEHIGTKQHRYKAVKELSGGTKRKLSAAIAIMGSPQLLIFDEPTSGLDPISRRSLWQILKGLRSRSTILLTTHHLDQAESLSDQLVIIQKGRIIASGCTSDIKANFNQGFKIILSSEGYSVLRSPTVFKNTIEMRSDFRISKMEVSSACTKLHLHHHAPQTEWVTQWLELNEIIILLEREKIDVTYEDYTLEECFIDLIRSIEGTQPGSSESFDGASVRISRNSYLNRSGIVSWGRQVIGIVIKNVYYHRGSLLKSSLLYSLNIIIYLFVSVFNSYMNKINQTTTKDSHGGQVSDGLIPPSNQSTSNVPVVVQGFILLCSAFVGMPIYQRELKIRQVLNCRSVFGSAYWVGMFLFDLICFQINLLIMSMIANEQIKALGPIGYLHLLGMTMILYAYTTGHLFSKLKTANTWFTLIQVLIGFVLMPIMLIGKDTLAQPLLNIKYMYPFYDISVSSLGYTNLVQPSEPTIYWAFIFHFLLLVCIETRIFSRLKTICTRTQVRQHSMTPIELFECSHFYGDVQALTDVSVKIGNDKTALLGHNGAGKSTIFSLISASQFPTEGSIYLEGQIRNQQHKYLKSTGVCYQQDALWEVMTPTEILTVMSWFLPIPDHNHQANWLWDHLKMEPTNLIKRFQHLSGGNKRKVCTAVALYGDPSVILLDECSTGLDPASRAALVETVRHDQDCSVVFTTHSIPEAEQMCSKILLMSKGKVLRHNHIYLLKKELPQSITISLAPSSLDAINKIGECLNHKYQLLVDLHGIPETTVNRRINISNQELPCQSTTGRPINGQEQRQSVGMTIQPFNIQIASRNPRIATISEGQNEISSLYHSYPSPLPSSSPFPLLLYTTVISPSNPFSSIVKQCCQLFQKGQIAGFGLRSATLEDVYMKLVSNEEERTAHL